MLRDEIAAKIQTIGSEGLKERVFGGLHVDDAVGESLLASLSSGHHLLILGPPGSGKTAIANRIANILDDIEVVEGCPLNCPPQAPNCPWCSAAKSRGAKLKTRMLPGSERVKHVQGGGELVPEDLIGALDPEIALSQGIHSISAFIPGKLLRANRGILLIDLIDRMPERALNTLFYALEGGTITIGAYEEKIPLDILVVATGSKRVLESLPLGLLEYFDAVTLDYPTDPAAEKQLVVNNLTTGPWAETLAETTIDKAVDIVYQTRKHNEIERGVSTRGTINYSELLTSLQEMNAGNEEKILRAGGHSSLPHRIQLPSYADVKGKREQLIDDILNQVLEGEKAEEMIAFSTEDMLALVEEITREEKFRRPLKYGAFDLLLKRVQRSPESKLAQLVEEMRRRLEELYSEQLTTTSLTGELLIEIEEARKRDERMAKLREEVEAKALGEALSYLEQQRILERGSFGWELSKRGVSFLLQRLTPQLMTSSTYGYGKHSTGRRLSIGEGREVGTRHYRFGDKYRDVSIKDTLREAIRNRRQMATKDDIMVTVKDIRAKMDIVLVVDLSGTMYQLEKLWQAKESAIALSIAAAQYGDRVGVVSFSNLADVVVDITGSPHRLTKRIIDLELHHNAFTNIGYGILKATQLFAHRRCGRANQHMIIISDGDATAPHPSPQRYALKHATRAARKGITISCVCLNEESTDPELMQKIAKIGKGRIYFVAPESITSALLEEQAVAKFS